VARQKILSPKKRTILGYSDWGIAAVGPSIAASDDQPTVIIVDDDPGKRESLEGLLRS
jgi:hypothetical protein